MNQLSEFETRMIGILETEGEPSIDDFGSLNELLQHAEAIGRSPLLPEFIRLVTKVQTCTKEKVAECWGFVENSLPFCDRPSALIETLDLVEQAPDEYVEALFQILINRFAEPANLPACRSAALDGALRYVIRIPKLRFELISKLFTVKNDNDRDLVRSAARILGVVHANWPANELFEKLVELSENVSALDQVAFEIGTCKVQFALNSQETETIEQELHDSQYWFKQSLDSNSDRHDSAIYLESVNCLLDFYRGNSINAEKISLNIKKHATFLRAWNRSEANPPWLLDETIQILYWETLACKLSRLNTELLEPSWYEPAMVVETFLILVWTASKSLLMRNSESGLENFVRPRIAGTIGATVGQACALKEWLRRNEYHNDFDSVAELVKQVDNIVRENRPSSYTSTQILDPAIAQINQRCRHFRQTVGNSGDK